MNRVEVGEYIYLFYCNRIASFKVNIYKAGITGNSTDIHRARLDLKKVFTLYNFFEILDISFLKKGELYQILRQLYRSAGKIREIQVNYLLLLQRDPVGISYPSLYKWMKEEEQRATDAFLVLVKQFDEKKLIATEKTIFEICQRYSGLKIRSKTEDYIRKSAEIVKTILRCEPNDKELHQIRKQLKAMAMVMTIVHNIKPGIHLSHLLSEVNKTEMMIGDWHDRVVLKKFIEQFADEKGLCPQKEMLKLNKLKKELHEEKQNLEQHFLPEFDHILEIALTI